MRTAITGNGRHHICAGNTRAGVVTEWVQSHRVPEVPRSHLFSAESSRGVRHVADEVRLQAPLFFLSYANSSWRSAQGYPRGPNPRVIKFFNDLSENVAELVGLPAGSEPGFIDRSIAPGARWTNELLAAVGGCQVFVALMSDPYVASPWCGMEWYAFTRRTVIRQTADSQSGVIPVIWTPAPRRRLPKVVTDVQDFSPGELPGVDIAAMYATEGVYGLMRMGQDMYYEVVVWRLAQRVAEFHFGHEVRSLVLSEGDLHDIFREDQP
jgi:hypothetical protein